MLRIGMQQRHTRCLVRHSPSNDGTDQPDRAPSVSEAAQNLGVTPQRVRAMIAATQLDATRIGGRYLVEASSLPAVRRRAGQPYSPRMAWGLISLAAGVEPEHLSPTERSRLRGRWEKMLHDPEALSALPSLLSRRGKRMRLSSPDPDDLLHDPRLRPSGRSAPEAGMTTAGYAEGYVAESDLVSLMTENLLVRAQDAENVTLHVIPARTPLPPVEHVPWLAVVADLTEGGARERQQAQALWREHARTPREQPHA